MSQTWIIKDTAPVDDTSWVFTKTDISFTSGGEKFVGIEMYDEGMTHVGLAYYHNDGTEQVAATAAVYSGDLRFAWNKDNEKYKKLEFDTAPTGELLAWLQKNATLKIPGINYQDIHLEDKALWNQLQTAWEQGDYTAALNVLKNANLADKQLNAAAINAMTTELLRLQNQKDTGFKQDKIVVSAEPPADLADGKVYFRLIGPTTGYTVQNSYFIEILQKNGTSYDTLNPYVYATDVQLPVDFQSSGQFMSLDAIMADMAGFFL